MKIKKLDFTNKYKCDEIENFVIENGYIYQSVKWAKIIKDSFNFEPLFLYLEENKKIVSVLPLFLVKFPLLKDELVSIPHVEAGGFINPEYYNVFFDYLKERYSVKNIKIYQFNSEIDNFPKNDYNSIFMMKVPEKLDDLYRLMRKRIKRSFKNHLKNSGIGIEEGNSEKFINILYSLSIIKHKEFGVPHQSYKFYYNIVNEFKNNCKIFIASKNGKYLGATLIIYYGTIGYHFYIFVPNEFLDIKKGAVGYILFFYVIKSCIERGMKFYSMGRSPKNSGAYKLKLNMKAQPYPLNIYNFTFKNGTIIPEKRKTVVEKYSWATKIWKQIPSFITSPISPWFRRWIY